MPHRVCLAWFRAKCCKYQRLHLHCFTSGPLEVAAWRSTFPRAYFGLTSLVKGFNEEQKRGVQSIPLDHLLLESDAPHLPFEGSISTNTPAYIGEIGEMVARIRGESLELVLRAASDKRRAAIRLVERPG